VATGPQRPADQTPVRAGGSIRRTSHVDAWWRDGTWGPLLLRADGRDLFTPVPGGGEPVVMAAETVTAEVDEERQAVLAVAAPVPDRTLAALRGQAPRGGFRLALSTADLGDVGAPGVAGSGNLVYALLDELPAVVLVCGYHLLRARPAQGPTHFDVDAAVDVCAGWAAGSSMVAQAVVAGQSPSIFGPLAPELADARDRWGWHDVPPVRPGTVRRRRRTDVGPRGTAGRVVDAMFRDSYGEPDGSETVIHEYAVRAVVDGDRLVAVDADPRVLPAFECPSAAASAGEMVGATLGDLRLRVRRTLRGPRTCTHLNDLLRTFADLPALVARADVIDGGGR